MTPIQKCLFDAGYKGLKKFLAAREKFLKPSGRMILTNNVSVIKSGVMKQIFEEFGLDYKIIGSVVLNLELQFLEVIPKQK